MPAPSWNLKTQSNDMLHLDMMRFFASCGIVFHHSHEFLVPPAERAALAQRTSGLALFVDLFFLISGYVIAHVYAHRVGDTAHILRFFQRRIGRLLPLHWLTLALSAVMWAGILSLNREMNHPPALTGTCLVQSALLIHAWASCHGQILPNGVSWSISAEMVLYALFPLAVLIGHRERILLLLIGISCFFLASHTALSHGLSAFDWTAVAPVARALPTFVFGTCLHFWSRSLRRVPSPAAILFVALTALFLAMMAGAIWPVQIALVYFVGIAAVAADLRGNVSSFVKRIAPLGQLTYSIYMWHIIFIAIMINIIGDKFLHLDSLYMFYMLIICYTTVLIWSYISLIIFEDPARRWIDSLFSRT